MFHNISVFLIFCSVYVRQSVASVVPTDGGNSVENFVRKSLADNGNRRTFATDMQVRIRDLRTERESLFINLKSVIYNEIPFL